MGAIDATASGPFKKQAHGRGRENAKSLLCVGCDLSGWCAIFYATPLLQHQAEFGLNLAVAVVRVGTVKRSREPTEHCIIIRAEPPCRSSALFSDCRLAAGDVFKCRMTFVTSVYPHAVASYDATSRYRVPLSVCVCLKGQLEACTRCLPATSNRRRQFRAKTLSDDFPKIICFHPFFLFEVVQCFVYTPGQGAKRISNN